MEISRLFGLPAHPLVIHLVVLTIPLMAMGVLLHVALPSRRHAGRLPLAGLSILTLLATMVAAGSGEKLEAMIRAKEGSVDDVLHQHTELGDQTQTIVIIWVVVTVIYLLLDWQASRTAKAAGNVKSAPSGLAKGAMALGVVAVLLGVTASVWDVRTGHTGAKSAWSEYANVTPAAGEGGDSDGD